ncbi:hypothetical protein [Streptomyces mangrovisoli]|uniref:Lipoprotein n=1 Tax=Streptomyces mangrovisoli TaxID=1428628 RepID=A0A1J4P1D8_9ACTN|nr:hypothetical protein [Streptomyces mangrovisoli]OIJ67293.1 hypothetical protein WN71_014040 [Streptomyces mangrovisoli]
MRAIRVASAALLGLTALTFAAPAAQASDGDHNITPYGFMVLPTTIAAGGQITLQVNRDGACRGSVTVSSAVFDTITIPSPRSTATATIDWDAKAGAAYQVTFACDGASGSTQLSIARGGNPQPLPLTPADHGVQAGEGGSFGGFDLGQVGLGAALIAGSVGAAYHFSRRRTRDDGV